LKKTRSIIATSLMATLILLLLGGALFVPFALAGKSPPFDSPPHAVQPNFNGTGAVNASVELKSGTSFYVYVDVVNVTSLLGYQVGFTFDPAYIQVTNVTDGGFLTSAGGSVLATFGFGDHGLASVNNATGDVDAVGEELSSGPFANGTGHLIQVGFKLNPALSAPGGPVLMMNFNVTSGDVHELILTSSDGTDITPPISQVNNGYITVTPVPEFSSVFFATLMITATLGAALFSQTKWPRKRSLLAKQ